MKGSPSGRFSGHVQIGLWPTTWHRASKPQLCTQGSLHFRLMQALFAGQSEFTAHSGRHAGGAPKNPGRQTQAARSPTTLHSLFGPHGDGSQGLNVSENKRQL